MNRILDIGTESYGYDDLVHYSIAARVIGVSPRKMRLLGSSGAIPVYKMSKRNNRFAISDLVLYSECRRVESNAPIDRS